jgi:hypothetical protein
VNVGVQLGVLRVDQPLMHDGVVEAFTGGDHAAIGLREGDGGDATLLPFLRRLAGDPNADERT